jgi:hypothetical protein
MPSDEGGEELPPPQARTRMPFGVWFMLGIFVFGTIWLVIDLAFLRD